MSGNVGKSCRRPVCHGKVAELSLTLVIRVVQGILLRVFRPEV